MGTINPLHLINFTNVIRELPENIRTDLLNAGTRPNILEAMGDYYEAHGLPRDITLDLDHPVRKGFTDAFTDFVHSLGDKVVHTYKQ